MARSMCLSLWDVCGTCLSPWDVCGTCLSLWDARCPGWGTGSARALVYWPCASCSAPASRWDFTSCLPGSCVSPLCSHPYRPVVSFPFDLSCLAQFSPPAGDLSPASLEGGGGPFYRVSTYSHPAGLSDTWIFTTVAYKLKTNIVRFAPMTT